MVSEGVICPAAASCEQGEPAEKKKPVRTTTRVRISLVSTECENEKKKKCIFVAPFLHFKSPAKYLLSLLLICNPTGKNSRNVITSQLR